MKKNNKSLLFQVYPLTLIEAGYLSFYLDFKLLVNTFVANKLSKNPLNVAYAMHYFIHVEAERLYNKITILESKFPFYQKHYMTHIIHFRSGVSNSKCLGAIFDF